MILRQWVRLAARRIKAEGPLVIVTVVNVEGSAPCLIGSRLLVGNDSFDGTIGGGKLEFLALEQARKLLTHGKGKRLQSYPLGPMVQQCCGGRVTLLFEWFGKDSLPFLDHLFALEETDRLVTWVDGEEVAKAVLDKQQAPLSSIGKYGDIDTTPCISYSYHFDGERFFEPCNSKLPKIYIFGAGHVGQALSVTLSTLDIELVYIDPRPEYLGMCERSGVETICTDDPSKMGDWWQRNSIAIIMTHSHDLDYQWTAAILRRNDSVYCGLIGSKTKKARFLKRLQNDGLSQAQRDFLTCPIGIDGIPGKTPGEIAIAVAAQLLKDMAARSHNLSEYAVVSPLRLTSK